jgi:hypothetical protein
MQVGEEVSKEGGCLVEAQQEKIQFIKIIKRRKGVQSRSQSFWQHDVFCIADCNEDTLVFGTGVRGA